MNVRTQPISVMLTDMIYDGAKKIIEEDATTAIPMCFIMAGGRLYVTPMQWRCDEEKSEYMNKVREICAKPETFACAMMTETWMVMPQDGRPVDLSVRPSQHPDRIDAMVISYQERGGKFTMAYARITTGADGKRTVGPLVRQFSDDVYGRMANFFAPAATVTQ